jgi:hypothetical protein
MQKLYFLVGLPRSGSTLLASLLNQHPDVFASPTSPLMDLLCQTDRTMTALRQQYNCPGRARNAVETGGAGRRPRYGHSSSNISRFILYSSQ